MSQAPAAPPPGRSLAWSLGLHAAVIGLQHFE